MDVEGYPLWSHFSSCPPSELLGERELNSSFKGTRGNYLILPSSTILSGRPWNFMGLWTEGLTNERGLQRKEFLLLQKRSGEEHQWSEARKALKSSRGLCLPWLLAKMESIYLTKAIPEWLRKRLCLSFSTFCPILSWRKGFVPYSSFGSISASASAQWVNSFLKFAHRGTNTRLPLEDEEESSEAALAAEEHDDGNSWFYDIRNYLKDRSFPSYATSKDKEIIRRIATRYVLWSLLELNVGRP